MAKTTRGGKQTAKTTGGKETAKITRGTGSIQTNRASIRRSRAGDLENENIVVPGFDVIDDTALEAMSREDLIILVRSQQTIMRSQHTLMQEMHEQLGETERELLNENPRFTIGDKEYELMHGVEYDGKIYTAKQLGVNRELQKQLVKIGSGAFRLIEEPAEEEEE